MKTFKTKSGLELPLMDMRGKDYLQVAHRLVWFRQEHPDWAIETELLVSTPQEALAKATIKDASGRIIATGHKTETAKDFPAGWSEKAETGAIGRALALCGYGTQFAPELDEGERIVDSPVQSKQTFSERPNPLTTTLIQDTSHPALDNIDPGDHIAAFGRQKGKRLRELSTQDIESSLAYWETRIRVENKPPSQKLSAEINAMRRYLEVVAKDIPNAADTGDSFL